MHRDEQLQSVCGSGLNSGALRLNASRTEEEKDNELVQRPSRHGDLPKPRARVP
jgi:hypothetical protein